ncbi:MAG: hypothetical protein M0D55_01650 [Elusimicrobiota bacterium]|nr:MAG: hypothetical protein M0D55_01650 [Elusimicrobiota bacterium]
MSGPEHAAAVKVPGITPFQQALFGPFSMIATSTCEAFVTPASASEAVPMNFDSDEITE